MASTQPFLVQRSQLALKLEATEGSGETIAAADVISPVFEPAWAPDYKMGERNASQPSFSRLAQISGERSATITFSTEVKGSGVVATVPPNLSVAMKCCGFGETITPATSVTYALVSSTTPTCTIELREGRQDATVKVKRITGARGTVAFEATKGNIIMAKFTFTGAYSEPTEGVFLTQPVVGPNPPPFLNAGFSLHGTSLRIQQCNIDIGNSVVLRNDANQTHGNLSAVIADRNPKAKINPEQEAIATANFFNKLTSNTEGVLTFSVSGGAGNIVTFSAPKAQIVGLSEADRDGIRTEDLDLQLNQNAAAGDDELTIVFT